MGLRLLAALLLLVPSVAFGQSAPPFILQETNPPIYGLNPGNQMLSSLTTLSSASRGTNYIANYFLVQDNGAQNTNPYGRTVEFDMLFGGGAVTGSRAAANFVTTQQSKTGNAPSGGNIAYGTLDSYCTMTTNDNGTGVTSITSSGSCSAGNFISNADQGATDLYALTGIEIDSNMHYGSSSFLNRALTIAKITTAQAQGTSEDAAIVIGSQSANAYATATNVQTTDTVGDFSCTCANLVVGGTFTVNGTNSGSGTITGYSSPTEYYISSTDGVSVFTLQSMTKQAIVTTAGTLTGLAFTSDWGGFGWKYAIAIGGANPSNWPMSWASTLIGTEKTGYAKNGIDFSLVTFSGNSLNLPGFTVDNYGDLAMSPTGINAAYWAGAGLPLSIAAGTYNDNTGTGVKTRTVMYGFGAPTVTATNAVTYTNFDAMYIAAPVASTNVTATNVYSLETGGAVNFGGMTNAAAGLNVFGGATTIAYNVNQTVDIGDGTNTQAVTIGGGSNTVTLNATTLTMSGSTIAKINASVNGNTSINTGTSTGQITIGNSGTTGKTVLAGLSTGTDTYAVCASAAGVIVIDAANCIASSQRFKTNIELLRDASPVLDLEVNSFQMKLLDGPLKDPNYTHPQIGLIAENVAAVVPDCAIYEDDMKTPKAYRPECITALLVKIAQDHQRVLFRQQWEIYVLAIWCLWLSWPRLRAILPTRSAPASQ